MTHSGLVLDSNLFLKRCSFSELSVFGCRQRGELEELRRQLEENSSLAGRALREEMDRSREEQERRHQVRTEGA